MSATPATVVTGYDPELKFYATKYRQGGRIVFSLDLSLAQIASLLPAPDPKVTAAGNRAIRVPHAASFATYVRTRHDWVIPAIVLRAPAMFDFEELTSIEGAEFGIISFPRLAQTDLRILDGQHRILGIHMAIKGIADDLDKARSAMATARKDDSNEAVINMFKEQIDELTGQRQRFDLERVSIQIFVEDEQSAFHQMFYDITDNALGIPGSVRVRFDTKKVVNRVLQSAMLHPLLVGRVEMERDRLGRSNSNLLSAKHVADIVRNLAVGLVGGVTRRLEAELSENDMLSTTYEFLDLMLTAFPQLQQVAEDELSPNDLRSKSMLGSPVTWGVLAGVYYELRQQGVGQTKIIRYFKRLNQYLSAPATARWVEEIGGNLFFEGGLAPTSRRQDLKQYKDTLVKWGVGRMPAMTA